MHTVDIPQDGGGTGNSCNTHGELLCLWQFTRTHRTPRPPFAPKAGGIRHAHKTTRGVQPHTHTLDTYTRQTVMRVQQRGCTRLHYT